MIKGAQKQMIVVKTADSKVFEEAYFVLRRERRAQGSDIVSEANRIIDSCAPEKKRGTPRLRSYLYLGAAFLSGGAVGGAIVGAFAVFF